MLVRLTIALAMVSAITACEPTLIPSTSDGGPRPEGGPGPITDDGAQSGSRLKINWLELEGTRTWNGFYDAQLQTSCHLRDWADGATYCTPDGGGSIAYSDTSCNQIVGRVYHQPNCTTPAPQYFIQYSDGCAYSPSKLYPKLAKVALASYFSRGSDGTCYGPYTPGSYDFYSLGGELAPSTLAAVTLGPPFGTTRLGQRDYSSTDGMYLPGTVHDAAAGIDCYPTYRYAGATEGTCVPQNAGYMDYFGDASCTSSVLTTQQGCTAPEFAVHYDDYCPTTEGRYFSVGAAISAPSLYYKSGATCNATTSGTDRVFATGNELQLASIHRTHDNSNGRYALIHYDTDGVHLRDSVLYDQEKQSECYLYDLPDGNIRCLPNASSVDSYFTDAACTAGIELMEVYLGATGCTPPPLSGYGMKYIPPVANACGYTYEVHAAQAQYTGPVYWDIGGACSLYTTTNSAMYRVGAAIPMSEFPAAVVSHD